MLYIIKYNRDSKIRKGGVNMNKKDVEKKFLQKAKIKKVLQKINKCLLFVNITLINTILLLTFVNADMINNIIDKITMIY